MFDYYSFSESFEDFKKQISTKAGLMFFMFEVVSVCSLFVVGFLLLLFFWGLGLCY